MVGTISPVVYRNSHLGQNRWLVVATIYTFGSVIGGGLVGLSAGFLGASLLLPFSSHKGYFPLLIGTLAVLYSLHELRLVSLPHPERQRQVPSYWRYRFHPCITAGLFGLLLGMGFTTFIPTATYYILGLAAFIYGSPALGVLIFTVYGMARALFLWPFSLAATTFDTVERLTQYMDLTKPLIRQVNGFALATFGARLLCTYLANLR